MFAAETLGYVAHSPVHTILAASNLLTGILQEFFVRIETSVLQCGQCGQCEPYPPCAKLEELLNSAYKLWLLKWEEPIPAMVYGTLKPWPALVERCFVVFKKPEL